jgi:hypothetical protein
MSLPGTEAAPGSMIKKSPFENPQSVKSPDNTRSANRRRRFAGSSAGAAYAGLFGGTRSAATAATIIPALLAGAIGRAYALARDTHGREGAAFFDAHAAAAVVVTVAFVRTVRRARDALARYTH